MEIAKITSEQALTTIRGITAAVVDDSWRSDIPCLIGGTLQLASFGLQYMHNHDGPLVFGTADETIEITHALETLAIVLDPDARLEMEFYSGPVANMLFKLVLEKIIQKLREMDALGPEIKALIDLLVAMFGL